MRKTIKRTLAFAILLLFPLAHAAVEIEHKPADRLAAGERIALNAEITDTETGIDLVRAYFKAVGEEEFLYAEMPAADNNEENVYQATLPAPAQNTEAVEYFLLVRTGAGEVVKSQNFTIDVGADGEAAAAMAALPPRDVVLEPSEFAEVDGFHGKLRRLTGEVEIVDTDGETRSPAETGFVVRESETLRTGADGLAVVDFDQDPITVLDHDSRVNVRTPTWFSHLAGKAYFAFKRLLGVGQRDRVVANTVALIGIRGTTFISYEAQSKGVALKEGTLGLSPPDEAALEVTRDGATESTRDYILQPDRVAFFDGTQVTETPFTDAVRADFTRFEAFAAGLLGAVLVAEQSRVEVHSESARFNLGAGVGGFDDFITLKGSSGSALGMSAASTTVVAATGVATTTIVGAIAGGLAVAAVAGDSGGGSSGSSTPAPGEPPPGSLQCNDQALAGGDQPESLSVDAGQPSGTVDFSWSMASIMDRMVVSYEGQTLFDTGCVSGTGLQPVTYSGNSNTLVVDVIPNCDGMSSGTFWSFTVACPQQP